MQRQHTLTLSFSFWWLLPSETRYGPKSCFVQRTMEIVWTIRLKQRQPTLSPENTVVDSCALHKTLLVVFFYHRAFLSLPQLSHSTNTGLGRATFSCLGRGDTECPAMACIKSMAHVSCFQSLLRSLYYLWFVCVCVCVCVCMRVCTCVYMCACMYVCW